MDKIDLSYIENNLILKKFVILAKCDCLSESRKLSGLQRHSTKSLKHSRFFGRKAREYLRKTECFFHRLPACHVEAPRVKTYGSGWKPEPASIKNLIGKEESLAIPFQQKGKREKQEGTHPTVPLFNPIEGT